MKRSTVTRTLFPALTFAVIVSTAASAQPFPDRIDLGGIPAGQGFSLQGVDGGDDTGHRATGIGDFNDDGFDDVAIAAIAADPNGSSSGSVYVVFGVPAKFLTNVELEDLDGSDGFRVDGLNSSDLLGSGLAGPGDVNDDGIDDLLIGAPGGDANGSSTGEVYVLFGQTGAMQAVVNLNTLNGTNGARIDGINSFDGSGISVSGAGDFNGDGIEDFLIGADEADPNGTGSGEAYLGFGRETWPETLELSVLNGDTGFVMNGADSGDNAGWAVSRAGDVNGDGMGDILIGAPFADPNGTSSGETYLVFGREDTPETVEFDDLDGSNGVTIDGAVSFDYSGYSVSGLGDLNMDGFDDFLIGAYSADPSATGAGESYIIYGRESWNARLQLAGLDGSDGVTVNGVDSNDNSGWSVSGAGDFNGDGFADALIGAPLADPNGTSSGEAYVAFGNEVLPATIELEDTNGMNGVTLEGPTGIDQSGFDVSNAGDFNGDGIGDLIIGGPDGDGSNGIAHVAFGRFETGVTLGATGGSCPGLIQLRSKGLTPNAEIEIYRGSGRGSSTIAFGPCVGFELDLADAVPIQAFESDGLGQWLLSVDVENRNICGTTIQLVDRSTCNVSNVTRVPNR